MKQPSSRNPSGTDLYIVPVQLCTYGPGMGGWGVGGLAFITTETLHTAQFNQSSFTISLKTILLLDT